MSLITIVIVIIVIGFLLWLVDRFIPMDVTIKRILQGIVILVLVLWLLQVFGVLGSLQAVRIK